MLPAQESSTKAKPSIAGTFKGNGQAAKLAFISARWREPFADRPAIMLVITEKDHTRDPKADFNAHFGRYGSALIISLHPDGGIFGCEVAHSAHMGAFSSVGTIQAKECKLEGGVLSGHLSTGGQADFFKQTWEVDLRFSAPLAGSPPAVTREEPKKKVAKESPPPAKGPAPNALNVKELPLPADAAEIEYKALVQHISCTSPSAYKAVAAEMVKKLTAQGWTLDGADRVAANPKIAPKSYILKATRGEANLTIFVKPAESGSTVTIFSKGLVWD